MRSISFVTAAAVVLVACATPVATPASGVPTFAGQATTVAAGPTATSDTSAPAGTQDPFVQNGIILAAPGCDGTFTPAQTEGPYYKAGSPEQNILYQGGMPGARLIVVGYVLNADCQPIPGAWLDFWQADANGVYDNEGYTLRGNQFTDEQGRYFLETVLPGEYPGRTEHIHVKVQSPGGKILTSQLYFPGVAANSTDGIYTPATEVTVEDHGDYQVADYDFVLNTK